MPDADAPTPPARAPRDLRKLAARLVLVALVAGAVLLWDRQGPVEAHLAFEVPPSLRTSAGPLAREDVRRVEARVLDADGAAVARASLGMRDGLAGPVTPAVVVRLPPGRYAVEVTLHGAAGRSARRAVPWALEGGGYQRLDLERGR